MGGDAAADGEHGRGGVHAADVLGRRLAADEDAGLAAGGEAWASAADSTMRPEAAPGEAAMPETMLSRGAAGSTRRWRSSGGSRVHAQHRLLARDDAVLGEGHGDADAGAGRAGDAHGVEDAEAARFERELDLHLLAQALAGGLAVVEELAQGEGGEAPRGRRAAAAGEGMASRLSAERLAALALAEVAADHAGLARVAVHELDHARAGFAAAHAQRHGLHDEARPRLGRGALGLAEEAGGGPLPGAGHGAEHLGELDGGVLGEGLVGLVLVGVEHGLEGGAAGLLGRSKARGRGGRPGRRSFG
jgi:hypothetical protein